MSGTHRQRMALGRSALVALLLLWSLGPMLWQLYTSLRSADALLLGSAGLGGGWTLANYTDVLSGDPPFWRYMLNSTVVGALSTLFTLALAIPCAYALSRRGGLLRLLVGGGLLAAAVFPYVLLFLALLEVARQLGLANNLLALSLPYAGLSLPLAVLLLQAAFAELPVELEENALLEGFSLLQRLRWILLPLMGPAVASTGLLVFLFSWNEFPIALTWLSRSELLTLARPWHGSPAPRCSRCPMAPSPPPPCWAACRCWPCFCSFNGRSWRASPRERSKDDHPDHHQHHHRRRPGQPAAGEPRAPHR